MKNMVVWSVPVGSKGEDECVCVVLREKEKKNKECVAGQREKRDILN